MRWPLLGQPGTCAEQAGLARIPRGQQYEVAQDPVRALIRTHLANERTFLAWLRSGLTSVALGVAAAQLLDPFELGGVELNKVLAVLLVAFGGLLVAIGRWRYRQTAIAIREGNYLTHRRVLEVVVVSVLVISLCALLVIVQAPASR